mgnify:CR=1 FL=1
MERLYHQDEMITRIWNQSKHNGTFDPAEFSRYQVKPGLRNADGTGVVAGLTRICNVHGYLVNEGERASIEGRLIYRGYDVEALANGFLSQDRFGFEEAAYLLLAGQLPNEQELSEFHTRLMQDAELPKHFIQDIILRSPSENIMNVLSRAVLALYSYDSEAESFSPQTVLRQSIRLIAAMPKMMVAAYEAKLYAIDNKDMHFHKHDETKSIAENILMMLRHDRQYTRQEAKLLDLCLVLHADHGGGNNSTFTVRTLTSALTDTYSAISAGIGSLKGFRHGGANYKVSEMLDGIRQTVSNPEDKAQIKTALERIVERLAGDGSGLIYGIGHAVYTLSDPRAKLLKVFLSELTPGTQQEETFQIACAVEELAPEVLRRKKGDNINLCANVDLYSGITYRLLGIPGELFTPLFCVSRVAGWCAHRMEELTMPASKIIRPAYKSIQAERAYAALEER